MTEEDCIFCKIANREIDASLEYEDEDVVAFKDLNPQAPVHLLVIPKRHIAKIGDLGPEDGDILLKLVNASNELAKKFNMAEEGYRLVINSGDNGGQTVYHLHVHVLGGRFMRWPPG
ncbi:MAG: histidine triad nucleotide-binding protein [Candidatus Omnitrophica bacterium]|nr:histidine triad nucleotide-binding protein [Candidatus Omnitrophota bacterium]